MRGKYRVVVKNKRLHYEFEIKRNITIIKGDSATGKTTLINMIRQFANLGNSSGVDLMCDVPCRTLNLSTMRLHGSLRMKQMLRSILQNLRRN